MKTKGFWINILIASVTTFVSSGMVFAESTINPFQIDEQDKVEVASLKKDISIIDSTLAVETNNVKNLLAKYVDASRKMNEIDLRLLKVESMMLTGTSAIRMIRTIPLSLEEYLSEYKSALQSFNAYDYDKALPIFEKLIISNPDNELADNAQYWLGECYYGIKDYERSLLEFEKVFTFPNNNKMDAAQLKLGICYLRLGNNKGALEEFSRLAILFPESEYIPIAMKLMDSIQ